LPRDAIQPEEVVVPAAPYSPVVTSSDLVVTAGQVAFDRDGRIVSDDIADQTRQVLNNLGHCLRAAGCGFQDVLKVTAFLADLRDFETFNSVYREYFSEPYPVRTTVQVGLAPGLLVEVEALARRPGAASGQASSTASG
jgi:2-iminobutanoate/2-iminopropanoate deaminase